MVWGVAKKLRKVKGTVHLNRELSATFMKKAHVMVLFKKRLIEWLAVRGEISSIYLLLNNSGFNRFYD